MPSLRLPLKEMSTWLDVSALIKVAVRLKLFLHSV